MNNLCHVGDVVKLKVQCLGNPAGAIGVCYESYEIGEREGASFIFENGNFDGFSPDEQDKFLELMWNDASLSLYNFKNVVQLSKDFKNGVFKKVFK